MVDSSAIWLTRAQLPALGPPFERPLDPSEQYPLGAPGQVVRQEGTIELPEDDARFILEMAKQQGITVSEIMERYVHRLRTRSYPIHPDVQAITGLLPPDLDVQEEYIKGLTEERP